MKTAYSLFAGSTITLGITLASPSLSQSLEEVVVTAQKRAQSIQDVPISITAFNGAYLEEAGIDTIEDISKITPNFTISNSSQTTNNRITIRGIGSVGNNGIEPSVGVFIDGVYYPRPGSVIGKLMDIQSFEVLRGPQGTLFGRNTPMGALNVTTRNPSQETEGLIQVGGGDYGAIEIGGIYNAPITNKVAFRGSFKYVDRDGYGKNKFDGKEFGAREDLVGRVKLSFDLNNTITALVAADYAEITGEGGAVEVLNSTSNAAFDATGSALFGDSPTTGDSFDWVINQEHGDKQKDEQHGLSVDITYDFSDGTSLRSITAHRDWKASLTGESALRLPTNLLPRFTTYQTETLSQELQFISPGGEAIDWVVGFFYYVEEYDINQAFDAGESYCVPTIAGLAGPGAGTACLGFQQDRFIESDFEQELESLAVFGQGTWNINERLNATLGIRWTSDQKEGDFDQRVLNPFAGAVRSPETVQNMKRDDSEITGFANISWYVKEDVMIFATMSNGYKSGGFNSEGTQQPVGLEQRVFDTEATKNYEIGIKSTLFNGTMNANATLFRTDIEDFQDRGFDGLSFTVVNAGEIRQQGLEADITWTPTERLRLVAGISYLDSEYLKFDGAPPLPGAAGAQNLAGERRNFSPEWQTSISLDWTQPFGDGLEWFVGGNWSWIDQQNIGSVSNNNPQMVQDAYSLLNGRMGIRSGSGSWDISLFGNNLTDEGYCLAIFDQPLGGSLRAVDSVKNTTVMRCVLGAPSTWSLKATYRF